MVDFLTFIQKHIKRKMIEKFYIKLMELSLCNLKIRGIIKGI